MAALMPMVGGQSTEVERLTMLLQKAADAIRVERGRNDELRLENESLRERAGALEGRLRAQQGGMGSDALAQQLRQTQQDHRLLAMENEIAVSQIAQLREENARLRSEAAVVAANSSANLNNGNTLIGSLRASGSAAPKGVAAASTDVRSHGANGRAAGVEAESPQRSTTHSSDLFARLEARTRGAASATAVLHPTSSIATSGAGGRSMSRANAFASSTNANAARSSTSGGASSYEYDRTDLALNRLRKAMAPPPTKEQMDEVIKAMVYEIQSQLSRRGLKLPMKRVKECCYESGKKRFNLSVDSNRLMVKLGGGNIDFLEFIERNRLCEAVNQS